ARPRAALSDEPAPDTCHSPAIPLGENRLNPGRRARLLAEAGLHRDPLTTLGAPARQHCGSALGLHARTESVLLRALTPVGLESALGHEKSLLLIRSMAYGQTVSINDMAQKQQFGGAETCRQKQPTVTLQLASKGMKPARTRKNNLLRADGILLAHAQLSPPHKLESDTLARA